MKKRDGFILHQMRRVLDNERYALIAVIALILIPYTSWVAMTILSLVTLRKGIKQAGLLVMPAITEMKTLCAMLFWKPCWV